MRKLTNKELVKLSPVKRRIYVERLRRSRIKAVVYEPERIIIPIWCSFTGCSYWMSKAHIEALSAALTAQLRECQDLKESLEDLNKEESGEV